MISYNEQRKCHKLSEYSQSQQESKGYMQDEVKNMTEITWDSALAGSGKYVKLEEGKRVTLVACNPRFEEVEKEFKGQEAKKMVQLTLDVLEEDGVECEKEWNTLSKRLIAALRPLFEGNDGAEVRLTVKAIGTGTDRNYDVEKLE